MFVGVFWFTVYFLRLPRCFSSAGCCLRRSSAYHQLCKKPEIGSLDAASFLLTTSDHCSLSYLTISLSVPYGLLTSASAVLHPSILLHCLPQRPSLTQYIPLIFNFPLFSCLHLSLKSNCVTRLALNVPYSTLLIT